MRLLNQLELALDELTADATEDDLAAEQAAAETTQVKGFTRRKPSRKPFPEHLPRERVVVPAQTSCGCCGSERLSKIGEDVTVTLEVIPRQWKVIQTIREKFTCREPDSRAGPPPRDMISSRAIWRQRPAGEQLALFFFCKESAGLPGRHVTICQMRLFTTLKKTHHQAKRSLGKCG